MSKISACLNKVKKPCYRFISTQEISSEKFKNKDKMLRSFLIPVCFWMAKKAKKNKTMIVGLSGGQGTGKTTISSIIKIILEKYFKLNVFKISIDDFYKTRKERIILSKKVHPLLKTRGVPGTHDIDQQDKETVQATVSWPIFSGGKNYAGLNKSKNLRNRKKLLLDNAIRINETKVTTAWSNMKSNASMLESVKLQVNAAEIANEGITAEYESGKGRSTLDVIQSNSILLNSQISLANSEREFLLSKFKLLQSAGILSADYLGLNK